MVIGHYPIAFVSAKKDGKIIGGMDNANVFYKSLLSPKHRVTYLCADSHNYQHTELITDNGHVTQVICGTGGARPDVFNDALLQKFKGHSTANDKYISEAGCTVRVINIANAFGFCTLDILSNGVIPRFNRVDISGHKDLNLNVNENYNYNTGKLLSEKKKDKDKKI